MITLVVGTSGQTAFFVKEATLIQASEHFPALVSNDGLGQSESGVLRFPTDDEEGWQVLHS